MTWRKLISASVLALAALAGCSNEPENDGSMRGTLAVSVAAMRDGTSQKVFRLVLDESERDERRLVFAEEPDLAPGSEIKVWGELDGNDILVRGFDVLIDDARNGTGQAREPLIDAPPNPDRTVGVVLVSFDGMATSYPPSRATTDYFGEAPTDRSLKRWFGESSYGVQDITGAVVTLTQSYFSCSTSPGNTTRNWVSDVDRALGFTPHHYVWVLLDATSSCGFYSLSGVGGGSSPARDQWIFGTTEFTSPNLGCALRTHGPLSNVGHPPSSSLDCGSETFANDPDTCTQTPFYDPEDAMSLANCRHLNAVGKQYEGWFGGCNSIRVNESGDFTLLPTEIECNGIQVLQVPMPTVGLPTGGRFVTKENGVREAVGFYYLELRTNTGFDSGSGRTPSVVVRIAGDYGPRSNAARRTFMLDMNPGTTVSDGMTQGQTFTDPAGGVAFTVQTLSNTSATVSVTVPTSAPNTCAGGGTLAAPGPATCTSAAGGMGGMGGAGGMAGAGGASAGASGAGGASGAVGNGGAAGASGAGGLGAGGMAGTGGGAAGAGATGGGNGGAGGEDAGGAGAGGDAGEGGASTGGSAGYAGNSGASGASGTAGASTGGAATGGAGRGGATTGGTSSVGENGDDAGARHDDDSGCGCRIGKAPPRRDATLAIGLLGILAVRRRRSRQHAS